MIGPAFMANESLGTRVGYRWRSTRLAQSLHRFKVRLAERKLDRAERALVEAVREIDRHAIVSTKAAALYRGFEAWAYRRREDSK